MIIDIRLILTYIVLATLRAPARYYIAVVWPRSTLTVTARSLRSLLAQRAVSTAL